MVAKELGCLSYTTICHYRHISNTTSIVPPLDSFLVFLSITCRDRRGTPLIR